MSSLQLLYSKRTQNTIILTPVYYLIYLKNKDNILLKALQMRKYSNIFKKIYSVALLETAIALALIILQLLLFLSVDVCFFFPFSTLGQLSNAFRYSVGFGLCSYFAVRLLCWKQRLSVPKFNFISCLFLVFSLENGSSSALATKVGYLHTALWLVCALMGLPNHAVSLWW